MIYLYIQHFFYCTLSISSFLDHIVGWIAPNCITDTSMGSLGGRLYPAAHVPDRHRCEIEKSTSRRIVLDSEIFNFTSIINAEFSESQHLISCADWVILLDKI